MSSNRARRVPLTASASARSSALRACGSRSTSASRRARAKPGGPTYPKSTCGSMPTTPRKDLLVLKIGGSVGAENDAALDAVVALNDAGHPLVVVHGGGPLVGEWAERMGMETRFVRGLRVSDAETRDLDLASGEVLNVNGDAAAGAIAASLSARLLVFVTDVPGVRGKDGRVIARLDADKARALVDDGTIEGGMLPKVEACLIAAAAGCRAAIVATRGIDSVERLLAGEQVGTVFEAAA